MSPDPRRRPATAAPVIGRAAFGGAAYGRAAYGRAALGRAAPARDAFALLTALCLALAAIAAWPASAQVGAGDGARQLVLIIDDMGNHLGRGRAFIDLPGRLNLAFLPHTPHARELARQAHGAGKEVLLHAPMTAEGDPPPGAGALNAELARPQFLRRFELALSTVPHARGVSNHRGSALTQRREQMAWLMSHLAQRDLYFVDSRTSPRTVAAATARDYGVPHLSRQVFLDHDPDPLAIEERFAHLLQLLDRDGFAVAIAHPYASTLDHLRRALPQLQRDGVELMRISEALRLAPPVQLPRNVVPSVAAAP